MTPVQNALMACGLPEAVSSASLSGGSIHDVRLVHLHDGRDVICKVAAGETGVRMLQSEVRSLDALAASQAVVTPHVYGMHVDGVGGVLVISYFERDDSCDWASGGCQLAALHASGDEARFGSDEEVWLGGTCLPAGKHADWCEYLSAYRLGPLLQDIRDHNRMDRVQVDLLHQVIKELPNLILNRPPVSLLHGDLWSGNLLPSASGIVLLDPASFYGDAWCDVGMMRLFGGIPEAMFGAWEGASHQVERQESRSAVGQLLHLLNHVRLFGGAYVSRTMQCVDQLLRSAGRSE